MNRSGRQRHRVQYLRFQIQIGLRRYSIIVGTSEESDDAIETMFAAIALLALFAYLLSL